MARAAPGALALARDADSAAPHYARGGAAWLTVMRRSPQLWIGGAILVIMVGGAFLAPWLAPYSPSQMAAGPSLAPPSASHWFGTDKLGRDTLSRALYGGRVSLSVSFAAVLLSLLVGVALGLFSGYWGGLLDSVLMRVMDGLLAFPGLILALTVAFALGPSVFSVIFALGIVRIPVFARIVRGQVLALRPQEFIVAAEVIGAPPARVVGRYLLPNLVGIILVQISLSAGAVIFAEASLGFLGLSVPPPTPTWGGMLHDGYAYLETSPWQSIVPGAIIFLAVLSFNFLGDGLQDLLDPRRRRRGRS
ncbi:MAG TPA: ABC transporter permease [Thermomicrobiales bacterium]|nr:ABC transporter permease [Thermomicrobiales bacterium]